MRFTPLLAAFAASSAVGSFVEPRDPNKLFTLEIAPGQTVTVTEEEKWEMMDVRYLYSSRPRAQLTRPETCPLLRHHRMVRCPRRRRLRRLQAPGGPALPNGDEPDVPRQCPNPEAEQEQHARTPRALLVLPQSVLPLQDGR